MPKRLKKSLDDIRAARRARREALERGKDAPPADMDEFRNALARRIGQFIGNRQQYWRGCPERICRRQRACAAPRNRCSNAPILPPDPDGRRTARVMAQVQRAIRARLEEDRKD